MKYTVALLFTFCSAIIGLPIAGFAQASGTETISAGAASTAQGLSEVPLNGEWRFMLDFNGIGVQKGWPEVPYKFEHRWDKVVVPHSYTADQRYLFYEGTAWYRRPLNWTVPLEGKRAILRFDAVFNRAQVWLNGKKLGGHEGGYTPFEFDVTEALQQGKNVLAVMVNNRLDSLTIPTILSDLRNGGNVGWVNYGGITRDVKIIIKPESYIQKIKVVAVPDLQKGTATIQIKALIRNGSGLAKSSALKVNIYKAGKKLQLKVPQKAFSVAAKAETELKLDLSLSAKDTELWSLNKPFLYDLELTAGQDTQRVHFGIRKMEVRQTKLYLNGKPVRAGGGNLVLDYPKMGSVVNDSVVISYMKGMKEAGMDFQRLTHYPLPESILNWADRNGMLLITEAGNWGYETKELDNPQLRAVFKQQLKEMIEANWNHPSVIAYSVGNEFDSHLEAGRAWVRDMMAFARSIDSSRLLTFASNKLMRPLVKTAQDEASQYCDFVSTNLYEEYEGFEKALLRIHELYPNKPLVVTEWGKRADQVPSEEERAAYIKGIAEMMRKYDFIAGASWWSFNDYHSRYAGTNANGFRPWGLVDHDLKPRLGYEAHQREFAALTVSALDTATQGIKQMMSVRVTARADFPSAIIEGYTLKYGDQTRSIPKLLPGQHADLKLQKDGAKAALVEVISPTGFSILRLKL